MKINEAFDVIYNICHQIENEEIFIDDAYGRVLAEDIFAKFDMPSFTNSAMDGFAYFSKDRQNPLIIDGAVFAGDFDDIFLKPQSAIKITTGAKLPINADSVLKIEDAVFDGENRLLIPDDIKDGQNVRYQGEELSKGDIILKNGDILDSVKLMILASQGIYKIKVYKKPKVGIFASGNEVTEPFVGARSGVYNSNAIGVKTLLSKYADVRYLGVLSDEYSLVLSGLSSYENFDLLVTIGAASVGDKDYMNDALLELGFERIVGNLKIKPAGPTKIYKKDSKYVLVLPGNPMSAYFGASIFGVLLLSRLGGFKYESKKITLKSNESIKVKNGRENLVLCNIKNGHFVTFLAGKLSSGQITPLDLCTHYVNIDQSMEIGEEIEIYELDK